MKVSLINASPNPELDERERKKAIASFPPLGILYLAAVLEEKGVEVSVLDQPAEGFTVDETVDWLDKETPDIAGFSTFGSSGRTATKISGKIKDRNPKLTVIFGNQYASFNSERILGKYDSVDIAVRGEGERTIVELVKCLRQKGELKRVNGIAFRRESRVVSTPDRPLIRDLDSLPFPNRSLIKAEYHCVIGGANVAPKKFTSVVSSRGCVYQCRFCTCTQFARNRWRPRSVRSTLKELQFLASEGYKQFIFVDDSFTANQKRVVKLCRKMREQKIDMEWFCEGRVDNCSFEMLREMAEAGCRILYFGIESANQRILDYFNKGTNPKQSEIAVRKARKAGIDVIIGSFIVGAPDETRAEIKNTVEFAKRIPIDLPQFSILGIYPGTAIWKEFEAKGLVNGEEYWETGISVADICSSAVPTEEIKQLVHQGFYDFMRRPSFISKQIARTMRSSYRMEVIIRNLIEIGEIREGVRSVA